MHTKIITRKIKEHHTVVFLDDSSKESLPCVRDFMFRLEHSNTKTFSNFCGMIDALPYRGANRDILDGLLAATKLYYKQKAQSAGAYAKRIEIFEAAQKWRDQFFLSAVEELSSEAYFAAWSEFAEKNLALEHIDLFADVHTQVLISFPNNDGLQYSFLQELFRLFNLRQLKLICKTMSQVSVLTGDRTIQIDPSEIVKIRKSCPAELVDKLRCFVKGDSTPPDLMSHAVVKVKGGAKYQNLILQF